MKKDVEVRCPDCGSILLVDVITGTILRHRKKGQQKLEKSVRFDEAADDVVERKKSVPSAFESAISTVKQRRDGLDDLFQKAVQKAEGESKKGEDEAEPESDPESTGSGAPRSD